MSDMRAVVIGAGPAGIRAAATLVAHGVRPVVVDEAATYGGQIYRRPPPGFRRKDEDLYGFEARRARSVHGAMAAILPHVDYRPRTFAWNAEGGNVDLLAGERSTRVAFTHLIVASGATDRVLPSPGWTLPGVYTLGGAQIALKFQGCAIGSNVVFAGTGPLLYLVAYQYAKAGAKVAAVLDTAGARAKREALPRMLREPAVLAKGLYYVSWLRLHGVPVHEGVRAWSVRGEGRVSGVAWDGGEIACDAVAFGHGLRPETQLADLLDCRFRFDPVVRGHVAECDAAGRSSVKGVYLAGDGARILGAAAAECAGERAALAVLEDAGEKTDRPRARALEARLAGIARFREALEAAFAFPLAWGAQAPDDLVVCRCENLTAGEIRACVRDTGATEMNRVKALTRVGMGRCQGRMCAPAAAEIVAHACGRDIAAVGRLRAQAPIKPIPFGVQS